jgi:hypothetical protein
LEPAIHPGNTIAVFAHLVRTRAIATKFAHQSLGNPKISNLLKATCKGFLIECPNISEILILRYLNPSPAMAKGHMKHPQQGIRSTQPKPPKVKPPNIPIIHTAPLQPTAQLLPPVLPLIREAQAYLGPAYGTTAGPNLIGNNDNISTANVFCFQAFADKNCGIVYHNLTGLFPFMSYNVSICFFHTSQDPKKVLSKIYCFG